VNEALENEPGVRNKLTYLDIKLAAAKSFLMKTIDDLEQDPNDEISPIQCKIFCTETAKSISLGVFKIFSAAGYTRENGIERIVRDIAALGIIGAPNYVLLERIASKTLAAQSPNIEENVTLKYARLSAPQIPFKYFQQATLGETMRIIGSENIKGVNVSYLDMTTGNPSGTFKDTLACLTLAHCLQNNIKAFCFSSSGNTGVSFAKYANHVGVKAILFYPKTSTYKLDHASFGKNVTAVEVNGTELQVKDVLARFSKVSGLPILPTLQNQIDGNKFRAHFLHEHYLNTGIQYDWHAQSVSSAMGPFGFYEGVEDIQKSDSTFKAPKFLAIQQEAVCPYVHRFGHFPEGHKAETEIVEPTLFRTQPSPDLYERMENILKTHGGKVDVLLNRELFQYQAFSIQKLQRKGIETHWVNTDKGPTMIEASGIICLSDVLKNIDQGKFEHGSSILVGITGGQRKTPPICFNPHHAILGTADDLTLSQLFKSFQEKL
jgi:threonine synthase